MKLNGGVQLNESGLKIALRAMQVQTALMSNVSQNVNGFDNVEKLLFHLLLSFLALMVCLQ